MFIHMRNTYKTFSIFLLVSILLTTQYSFAHWTSRGPFGGAVKCFLLADTNLYVGSTTGGIFRSTNKKADAWRYIHTGLTSGRITSLAALGVNIIAGTADSGIYISKDIGTNWGPFNKGLGNKNISALLVSGTIIFAGTNGGGMFISADTGKTWQAVNNMPSPMAVTCMASSGNSIYAGTNGGGIFESNDNGNSWTAINNGLGNLAIGTLTAFADALYAGTANGIFTTSKTSISWTSINTGLSNTSINALTLKGDTLYAATDGGVFYSKTASVNWTAIATGLPHGKINAISTWGNKCFAGTNEDGIYSSTSGIFSWTANNTGFNNLHTYALFCSGNLVATANNHGVFICYNFAANPVYIRSNKGLTDSLNVTCLVSANTKLYAGTRNNGIFESADSGKTWHAANTGLSNLAVKTIFVTAGKIFIGTSDGDIFSTLQTTINWSNTGTGIPVNAVITAFATDGSKIFAATNGNGVYSSTDGTNWNAFNTALTNQEVTSLAVLGNHLFAGTLGNGVLKSPLDSPLWTEVNNGLPSPNILSLGVTGNYLLAGYKGGAYMTLNQGNQWAVTGILLYLPPFADVTALAFTTARMFAATPDNSVYSNSKAELPLSTGTEQSLQKSIRISPNPNNGNFRIIADQPVVFTGASIYNISGKLVKQFTSGNMQEFKLDCPKGIYFIELKSEHEILTQKIIVQ